MHENIFADVLQAIQGVMIGEAQHLREMLCRQFPRSMTRVEPLQHGGEGHVAPLWDFDLRLSALDKTTSGEHRPEMLTLGDKDGLVCVDAFALDNKSDIAELATFQKPAHVLDEGVYRNIV